MNDNLSNIRNFSIISHVDHGKSTLADRFLEITNTVESRKMKNQYLDQLELERERGITIKMAPVRMTYALNAKPYTLNLIDTPGHPDFAYEVSRSLAVVEGAILLVDASCGIQAQTLANFYAAKKAGLTIIGAVNKIDLSPPQLESVIEETANLLGCSKEAIFKISGKTGYGMEELLEAVIRLVPPPCEDPFVFHAECLGGAKSLVSPQATFGAESQAATRRWSESTAVPSGKQMGKALIFDSFYDDHRGIIASIRIFDGELKEGDTINFIAANEQAKIKEIGFFIPQIKKTEKLSAGEIGCIVTGIKDPAKIRIGDTIIQFKIQNSKFKIEAGALPGYQEPKAVVFVSFYPDTAQTNADRTRTHAEKTDYDNFKKSLERLRLNDSSLRIEPDFNEALGRGFRIGFLGKLHFEITSERLDREFNIKTINSFPSVAYKIGDKTIETPQDLPNDFKEIWEQIIEIEIMTPPAYLGNILQLKDVFRIKNIQTQTWSDKVLIAARMPLAELISDFDDALKSVSAGFASFSYQLSDWQKADLVKMDILVAGEIAPGLTRVVPRKNLEREARRMVENLKKLLPRQQFSQAVQAQADNRIIARETVPAMRKDVTGYLYGGDRTRKMKLWKKQQKGKKKLLERAQVKIPVQVFKNLLKLK